MGSVLGFCLCKVLKAGRAGALRIAVYLRMCIKYERNTEGKNATFDCSVQMRMYLCIDTGH